MKEKINILLILMQNIFTMYIYKYYICKCYIYKYGIYKNSYTNLIHFITIIFHPLGSFCGSLSSLKASELGSIAIKESLARIGLKGTDVSEIIMGQVCWTFDLH